MRHSALDSHTPLGQILVRLAEELRDLDEPLRGAELAVGQLMNSGVPAGSALIQQLQSIDVVIQTLASLANFMERLSGAIPASWRADVEAAATGMTLAATLERLCSRITATPGQDRPHGGVEYFEDL